MYKKIIAEKLFEYLKLKEWDIKKSGKLVMAKCPVCKKEPLTASIIPNVNEVHCIPCNIDIDIIEFVKILEPEYAKKIDEDIYTHLKELFNINIQTKKNDDDNTALFNMYKKNGFSLTPLYGNTHDGKKPSYGKRPVEGEWQKKEHKDPAEWKQWLINRLNIGIRTGEVSDLTVVDIDSMPKELKDKVYQGIATPEEKAEAERQSQENLKKTLDELGHPEKTTIYQITYGGLKLLYKYVPELQKTRIETIGETNCKKPRSKTIRVR